MGRGSIFLVVWAALAIPPAGAQDWVATVFPERAYDFGTVARGSKVLHTFKLVNRTNQEIHIADWRTKCGCTEVRVGAREIPPETLTTIEAVVDTTKFEGYKASGLTLVIDRPSHAEVDLNLTCFIQSEIVLNPGQIDFGIVRHASKPTLTLTMNYHGGRPDFAVSRMQTRSGDVTAKVQELGRTAGGAAQFVVTATLNPSAPNGIFRDEVRMITNDPAIPALPISVTANVQSAVTVSPSVLNLGRVRPGQVIKKTIMVRSSQPFKLTEVKPSDEDLSATPDPDGSRPLHMVNLTFKAPTRSGPYHAVCEIATDLKDEPTATLSTFATITP
jgi:Protein of unknown function (DUF1573)